MSASEHVAWWAIILAAAVVAVALNLDACGSAGQPRCPHGWRSERHAASVTCFNPRYDRGR